MPAKTSQHGRKPLPTKFADLVQMMPPQAVVDDVSYENTVEMIDRLMTVKKLSKGQALYLETLVQLVQVYEAEHYAIDTSGITGLDALRHILAESGMSKSGLAKLLGVHSSMGSKILKGDRSLTAKQIKVLATHFKVSPALFLE